MPEAFLEFASAAYDAGLDPSLWPDVLRRLTDLLKSDNAALGVIEATGALFAYHYGDSDPVHLDRYNKYYQRLDPMLPVAARNPGKVICDEMVMPKSDFRRTEMYADWCQPAGEEHAIGVIAYDAEGVRCGFSVARSPRQASFVDADIERFTALLPHLRRALAVQVRLATNIGARRLSWDVLSRLAYGVFLIRAGGAVIELNTAAQALLKTATGLVLRAGRLSAALPTQSRALDRLLMKATDVVPQGGWLTLDAANGGKPLRCFAIPIRAEMTERFGLLGAAALVLVDAGARPDGREDALAALFGLTRAEAYVAQAVVGGQGVGAVAAAAGVAPSTVRTHLGRIFSKTGTSGQTELAAVIARLPAETDPAGLASQ